MDLPNLNILNILDLKKINPQTRQHLWVLVQIAIVWIVSYVGYYVLLPILGETTTYNNSPIAAALYYVFWTGVAIIAFWPVYLITINN
ncbi:hypothetical protein J4407_01390 [Candidatus Pacearchaeota archaeon]|nr:hypothetical protein [Candidatus Pacearchaeota archaeon]